MSIATTSTQESLGTQRSNGTQRSTGGYTALTLTTLGFAMFGIVMVWMMGFLWNIPTSPTMISAPSRMGVAPAFGINLALLALFGIQHSVMSRDWAKRAMERLIDAAATRGLFIIASSAVLAVILWCWQPIGPMLWQVTPMGGRLALYGVGVAGLVIVVWAILAIDPVGFLGFRAALDRIKGRAPQDGHLVEPLPYSVVRHPMQLGVLMLIWATPQMTAGHLLFASGMTLYVFIGLHFEERALIRTFGEAYVEYKQRVPGLLPRVW